MRARTLGILAAVAAVVAAGLGVADLVTSGRGGLWWSAVWLAAISLGLAACAAGIGLGVRDVTSLRTAAVAAVVALPLLVALVIAATRPTSGHIGHVVVGRPVRRRGRLLRAAAGEAYDEHASVPAFAEASLMLMAAGAPLDLVERCHLAALDEVRHARSAAALAGQDVENVALPGLGGRRVGSRSRTATLVRLGVGALRDGCVGESRAVDAARAELATTTDPRRRAHLEMVVADETRHAALAYDIVAFVERAGGPEVRAVVAAARRLLAA